MIQTHDQTLHIGIPELRQWRIVNPLSWVMDSVQFQAFHIQPHIRLHHNSMHLLRLQCYRLSFSSRNKINSKHSSPSPQEEEANVDQDLNVFVTIVDKMDTLRDTVLS